MSPPQPIESRIAEQSEGPPLPPAAEARLELLSRRLAERGYQVRPLPADARALSPCGRGPVIATVVRDGQLVGNVVRYGDRLTYSSIQVDALSADIENIWASPEWRERFGAAVAVPGMPQGSRANLSATSRRYLAELGAPDPDGSPHAAALIWRHALAIGYSPAYLREHGEAIREDWPRVPLPDTLAALWHSAALGARVAALLDDPAAPTDEVPAAVGQLSPPRPDGLEVRAGWGHQTSGAVMPGRGRVTEEEGELPGGLGRGLRVWLDADTSVLVPTPVWEYRVGGYQVLKKWLSYREFAVLGRTLTGEEVGELTGIVRRISALVLLGPELDASYQHCRRQAWRWPQPESPASPAPAPPPVTDLAKLHRDPTWLGARQRVENLVEAGQIVVGGPIAVTLTPEARGAMRALRQAADAAEAGEGG